MELHAPDRETQLSPISELFARTFSDYWDWIDYNNDGYLVGAPYDWTTSRVGLVDGQLATHFGVWDFSMRIGMQIVRVAGIGAVATDRSHQGRGLMTRTAADSVNSLKGAGYDLSLLFGIPNFYTRFGYAGTFAEHRVTLETRKVGPADPVVRFEPFEGDFTEFAALYNKDNAGVTGTFVRPTFATNHRPKHFSGYTLDGGYLVAGRRGDELQVADCAGPPEKVLDIARQLAIEQLAPKITFVFVPDRSPMGDYLHSIPHSRTQRFNPSGGPMIKVVNLRSTFQKISGALSARLQESALDGYSGWLAIHGDGEAVMLQLQNGEVSAVEDLDLAEAPADGHVTAGISMGRLIIGDDDPGRVCRQAGITVAGDAVRLVPILFPNEEPSTILWDRF